MQRFTYLSGLRWIPKSFKSLLRFPRKMTVSFWMYSLCFIEQWSLTFHQAGRTKLDFAECWGCGNTGISWHCRWDWQAVLCMEACVPMTQHSASQGLSQAHALQAPEGRGSWYEDAYCTTVCSWSWRHLEVWAGQPWWGRTLDALQHRKLCSIPKMLHSKRHWLQNPVLTKKARNRIRSIWQHQLCNLTIYRNIRKHTNKKQSIRVVAYDGMGVGSREWGINDVIKKYKTEGHA